MKNILAEAKTKDTLPQRAIMIFCGIDGEERSKAANKNTPVLVIPQYVDPANYELPVNGRDVVIHPAKDVTDDYLKRLQANCAIAGAASVNVATTVQKVKEAIPVKKKAAYRPAAGITAKPINPLWPDRFARGKVSLIAGAPGLGKSQVTIDMATTVSTGKAWPDGSPCKKGNVVLVSAEDDAADTVVPRLIASGAEMDRVFIMDGIDDTDQDGLPYQRPLDLVTDISAIEDMLIDISDVSLLVIDPVTAYLGTTDSHKNAEVRGLMARVSDIAEKLCVAVIMVTHLNKNTNSPDALSRITGSGAFPAVARAAYLVIKDPDNDSRRLFLPAKNNIGPDETGLAFTVEGVEIEGISTSRIVWDGEVVTLSANDAMSHDSEALTEREEAREWLKNEMTNGVVKAGDIKKSATDAGFAWHTVKRARTDLGIKTRRRDFDGGWEWFVEGDSHMNCSLRSLGFPSVPLDEPPVTTQGNTKSTQENQGNSNLVVHPSVSTADEYRQARDGE